MSILLSILKTDKMASKCKMSAHMILVSIKGISRIIERISSRNEFVAAQDLNDLLTQTINWSLFMLQGEINDYLIFLTFINMTFMFS
jgi:hypothetical protein